MLALSFNNLTGPMPASVGSLSELEDFDVEYNSMTGQLPRSILNLTGLVEIGLGGNQFDGELPSGMCGLPALRGPACDLSHNNFSCPLPACARDNCKAVCG